MTSLARRPWFIATASVAALAVGVGAYFVATPFAPVEHRAPELVDAWTLVPNDGLSPLDATSAVEDEAPTAVVASSDGGPAATIGAAMTERLAAFDARILTGDAALTLPSTTRSALGVGVSDPCAASDTAAADCPAGSRATVLGGDWEPELWITANYRSNCAAAPSGTTAAIFQIYSTLPATFTITYDVLGESRQLETSTTADDRAAWEAAGGAEWVANCVVLPDLPAGWSNTVLIEAVDDFGAHAEIEAFVSVATADQVPPSWIEPITPAAIMVSIPTRDVSSVRFIAFAVPFGQDAAACDFDDDSDVPIQPVHLVDETFSAAQLEERGYNRQYIERHTAAFIVPEGSTISVCAGWVDAHSWGANVPDHVYSQVLHSPDYAMPVVTVDSFATQRAIDRGAITLTASVGPLDAVCGTWQVSQAAGAQLCDYAALAGRSKPWDSSLVIRASASGYGSSGVRQYVLPVGPRLCGIGCELPRAEFFDVPLESRSDPCLGNGCAPSGVGTVRLRVEWIEGNDSWADSWTRDGAAPPTAAAPVLDRRATVTLGALSADGLTQSAQVRITADRESSVLLTVNRSFRSSGVERVVVDPEFLETRTVTLENLPAGEDFALTVELTDRDGNTSVYSALESDALPWVDDRPWVGGRFSTDSIEQQFAVTVTMSRADGRAFAYGNYALSLGSTVWSTAGGGSNRWTCVDGTATVDLGTATTDGAVRQATQLYLSIELADPRARAGAPSDCASAEATSAQVTRPTTPRTAGAWMQLSQLQAGATVTTSIDDLTVQIRVTPVTP